jgi:4-amino-4-deoxy-L-arabinose transferase-like glycosyltransferase
VRSHSRALAILLAAALLSFLPGFFQVPPVDRDEARFAQATKQMIESGDFADIRFREEARHKKPPGAYWMQAAAVETARALGFDRAISTIWVYRLPSLAGAIAGIWLTYWAALALVSRRAALLAGLMMASSVLLGVEARMATTDALLLPAAVAAMGALARAYLSAHDGAPCRWPCAAVFWAALAAGVVIKGPVIPAVAALCALTLSIRDRSARWILALRPLAGLVFFTALTLPWLLVISSHTGGAFAAGWARDIFPRLFAEMEGHGAPPGYYAVLFWVTFWPGCAITGLAVPAVFAARREPATAFLLAWLVPSWIALELSVTKLPHYVLPLYPGVAILIAGSIGAPAFSKRPILLTCAIWLAVVPLVVAALGVTAFTAAHQRAAPLATLLCGGAVLAAFAGWRHVTHDRIERAVVFGVLAALLLSAGVYGAILPRWRAAFPSEALVEMIETRGCREPMTVTTVAYDEPSLTFLAGTSTRQTDVSGAVTFLAGGPCRFAVIATAEELGFVSDADTTRLRYDVVGRVDAFNYSKGTSIALAVYSSGSSR